MSTLQESITTIKSETTEGANTATRIGTALEQISKSTGWGNYGDGVHTEGSPLQVPADTDTVLPNNKATTIETEKPYDVTTFYDGSVIKGKNGDGLLITIDLKAKPTQGTTTYLEIWFDIGGSVGQLYKRIISFPKGAGVERPIDYTVSVYTLDTWEDNGATVYVRANGTIDLYDIRYIITRTHKSIVNG